MTLRRRFGRVLGVLAAGAALVVPAVAGLTAPAMAAPPPAVDMRATIEGAAVVRPGELMALTIGTVVPGPPLPTGIKLTVTFPEGVTYEGGNGGSGPCEGQDGGRIVVCIPDPGAPAAGGRVWEFSGRAASSLAVGTELTTTVVVSSDSQETNPSDNTATLFTRVTERAATYLEITGPPQPLVPGESFRVGVRAHYAEGPPIDGFDISASFDSWWGGGRLLDVPALCSGDPGRFLCETEEQLEAGDDLNLVFEFDTNDDPANYRDLTFTLSFTAYDLADDLVESSIRLTFTAPPPASPSPSASPSATSASPTPTPTGTDDGDDDQAGGGLPITGTATTPLVAAGALLVLTGAVAVSLSRRRRL